MIQKSLSNSQKIWVIFIKVLKNTIKIRNGKCQSYMMIWLLICLVIKRPHPIITELFVSGRKVNILLVFVTQLYFAFPKTVRLNSTNYFVAKIPN